MAAQAEHYAGLRATVTVRQTQLIGTYANAETESDKSSCTARHAGRWTGLEELVGGVHGRVWEIASEGFFLAYAMQLALL